MQNDNSKFKSDLRQRCFTFGRNILRLVDKFPNSRTYWVISDQLIRSATSIAANLFEARGASSRLEFKRYYEISLKSANETKYWLLLLHEINFIERATAEELEKEVCEIANMLAAGVIKLKKKPAFNF